MLGSMDFFKIYTIVIEDIGKHLKKISSLPFKLEQPETFQDYYPNYKVGKISIIFKKSLNINKKINLAISIICHVLRMLFKILRLSLSFQMFEFKLVGPLKIFCI